MPNLPEYLHRKGFHRAALVRHWRKLHIAIDAKTLQIRAVQLTTNNVSDSQVLEDLLAQIPLDEQLVVR